MEARMPGWLARSNGLSKKGDYMNRIIKYWLSGASAGLIALATQPADAQSAGESGRTPVGQLAQDQPSNGAGDLEPIVVTARRASEKLQDVPIAVTVVTQKTLQEDNINNINDIEYAAPGLSNQQTSGLHNFPTFSIRGQGQTFGQSFPGVVVYFSDVPQELGEFGEFYDMDNVQVLKGPQGTLFGRNTTGGAVLFTPNKPTNDFSGYFDARLGDYDRQEFEGAIGGPIIPDKVLFRIAGESLNREGYTLNLFNGEHLDDEDRWSTRAELDFKPTDRFDNYTQFMYTAINEAGAGESIAHITPTCNNGGIQSATTCNGSGGPFDIVTNPANFAAMQADLAAQTARGPRFTDLDYPTLLTARTWVAINTSTLNVADFLTLKNIYSYRYYRNEYAYDFDGLPLQLFGATSLDPPARGHTEEFQAEINQGRFNGVIGYFTETTTTSFGATVDPVYEYFGFAGGAGTFYEAGGSKDGSNAVYGQGNYEVFDGLTLTGGYRYTWDQRTTISSAFAPGSVADAIAAGVTSSSASFQAPTWTFAADYKVNPDVNVYGTVRRGYKSGGFNATAPTPADRLFEPEFVIDYEAGVKTNFSLAGIKAILNLDGFYDDYTNIQRYVNLATSPPSTITTNAAAGTVDGADIDLTLLPSIYFDVSVRYTYERAWYTKWIDALAGNLDGQKFPNTPTSQLTVTPRIHYALPGNMGRLNLIANVYYQSSEAYDPYNTPNGNALVAINVPAATVPGYTKVDLRAEWADMFSKGLTGALFAQNLTNKVFIVGSNNQLPSVEGTSTYTYGAPRMFGVELNYKFGH
jgi:iron complex outermembrane receptor protein